MIKLNPTDFPRASAQQIERFKLFLDRNFPGWRDALVEETDTVCIWSAAENWRHAKLWGDFVELWDDTDHVEGPDNLLMHRICNVDGDITQVATWRRGD